MNTKHDYATLEREYIQGDMGLRELARAHGITNHSVVVAQSKARDWVRKREEYRQGASETAVAYMAADEGARVALEAKVRDNAIEAIDEAITKMRSDMQGTRKVFEDGQWVERPYFLVKPTDVAMLIDRLQVLFGRPSNITEERNLGLSLSASGVGTDILRGIVEATRGLTVSGPERSPIPRLSRAGEN
jgi:transposase-like protein